MSATTEINPMQLSVQQLNNLKIQHEEELQQLQRQLETLHGVKSRLINSNSVLDVIGESTDGAPMLIPLNGSLYVPGRIANPERVIVELGTGYFCEKSIPDAKDLINRKMQLIGSSMESIEGVGVTKKKQLEQINMILQYKLQQSQDR